MVEVKKGEKDEEEDEDIVKIGKSIHELAQSPKTTKLGMAEVRMKFPDPSKREELSRSVLDSSLLLFDNLLCDNAVSTRNHVLPSFTQGIFPKSILSKTQNQTPKRFPNNNNSTSISAFETSSPTNISKYHKQSIENIEKCAESSRAYHEHFLRYSHTKVVPTVQKTIQDVLDNDSRRNKGKDTTYRSLLEAVENESAQIRAFILD